MVKVVGQSLLWSYLSTEMLMSSGKLWGRRLGISPERGTTFNLTTYTWSYMYKSCSSRIELINIIMIKLYNYGRVTLFLLWQYLKLPTHGKGKYQTYGYHENRNKNENDPSLKTMKSSPERLKTHLKWMAYKKQENIHVNTLGKWCCSTCSYLNW